MELSSLLPSLSPRSALPLSLSPAAKTVRRPAAYACRCCRSDTSPEGTTTRRWFASLAAATAAVGIGVAGGGEAGAVSTSRRVFRSSKIPESEFTTLPNGIKYYDIKVGGGAKAVKGSRVAVCTATIICIWSSLAFPESFYDARIYYHLHLHLHLQSLLMSRNEQAEVASVGKSKLSRVSVYFSCM
ncbi:uncharacterized protein LOC124674788 [Lolium rigidum]|uniref:uncharacterized protein LOC124674788 n=1 Tax=Lolium rigidum TaxID=89674 RepID=UPI001F5D9337|nr:uncharacterized protein LOC124674788 [Lolium rigidum]